MRKGKFVPFILTLAVALFVALLMSANALWSFGQQKKAASPDDLLCGAGTGATRVVDMTYAINGKLPAWPGDDKTFEAQVIATPEKDGYFARSFWMLEHYATHMDAPAHFPPGKFTLDQIPVAHFFGPAVVIDVREEVGKDPDYRLSATRIEKWEAAHGRIPSGAIVMLRTGWSSRWPDQARYRNMDASGVMHFPGFSVESAKLLIARGAVGLGIDTLSIDYGASKDFEVHHTDLPAGLYNLENLANLDQLPEAGAFVIAAPIKLEGGSGGPVRVFALLPAA
ncbi:MAG: cyclase family protein [Candidatus Acidiferrales bacterium]